MIWGKKVSGDLKGTMLNASIKEIDRIRGRRMELSQRCEVLKAYLKLLSAQSLGVVT